jgi:hypothetical protein
VVVVEGGEEEGSDRLAQDPAVCLEADEAGVSAEGAGEGEGEEEEEEEGAEGGEGAEEEVGEGGEVGEEGKDRFISFVWRDSIPCVFSRQIQSTIVEAFL